MSKLPSSISESDPAEAVSIAGRKAVTMCAISCKKKSNDCGIAIMIGKGLLGSNCSNLTNTYKPISQSGTYQYQVLPVMYVSICCFVPVKAI